RLWENENDPTSQTTIVFTNTNAPQAIQKGDGLIKTFEFDIEFVYSAAQLVPTSIKVYTNSQLLQDATGNGAFYGDGSGTIEYTGSNKGSLSVQFTEPPSATETVWVEFETKFDAGDQVELLSNTNSMPVSYMLPMNVNPGDALTVIDPIQSIYAAGIDQDNGNTTGVSITRNSLNLELGAGELGWIDITSGISGRVSCIEFSTDGNHMFVGTGHFGGSTIYRVSGLNNVYTSTDVATYATVTNLGNLGGSVTGIAVDPNDPNNVVATSGNYGQSNFVWRSTNATTSTGNAFTSIQGNLPVVPCYDAVIMVDKPGYCVVGTDMGVYATSDVYADPVVWSDENCSMAHTPVFAVRQQSLSHSETPNRGKIYLGTHGRAMWESTAGTGIGEFSDGDFAGAGEQVSDLLVYPNPMTTNGTLSFELANDANATIQIYDMTGKIVKSISINHYSEGMNNVTFDVTQLRQGTYFVTVESNDSRQVAKFVVM
ncbi:MAG: T9SS type A sorting domain-containing protein, partial [Flavobacteriales bacterium]|nr:T9SS type A sorting domain-containing protein [Flavobacteriales bacterium]